MREILFRGKTEYGGWAEGSLILAERYCCILQDEEEVYEMDYPYLDGFVGTFDGNATPVIPETVGQYTGLKDKNGTKIFEGDIVKHSIGTFVVKFLNGTFCCSLIEDDYLTDLCSIHNQCEVIGNIHDNPELLGEKNG